MNFILRQFWQVVWGMVSGLLMGLVLVWVYILQQMPATKTKQVQVPAATYPSVAQK
jgi:uncharacterized membrane protein